MRSFFLRKKKKRSATERAKDALHSSESGKELAEAVLKSKVNQTRDKTIREILSELPPEAIWLG